MDRRQALWTLGATAAAGGWAPARAQDKFPTHMMRIVVGYPPGGVTDINARVVAESLGKKYGQPVVVENRPGASGTIGQMVVAKALPDGYVLNSGGLGGNVLPPLAVEGLPLDVLKSLVPVAMTSEFVNILVVGKDNPANNLQQFIDNAKARKASTQFGANGIASSSRMAGEFFATRAGVKMEAVNYKGTGEILVDVANGGLECTFANLPAALPLLRTGKLKPLGVTSNYRSKHAPDIPTMEELGLPDFNVTSWLGIYAPAGTPRPILEQLSKDIVEGAQQPEERQHLETAGLEVRPLGLAAFEEFTQKELAKWGAIVNQLHIKQKFGA